MRAQRHPEIDFREPELCAFDRDTKVTAQSKGPAATNGVAIDSRNRHLLEVNQDIEQAANESATAFNDGSEDALAFFAIGDSLDLRQICTSGECVTGSGENQDPHVFIVSHLVQETFQLQHDLLIERIAFLWPVE